MERCGDCHQRGGATNQIPVSGGYIRHHEQINEMRASKHGTSAGLTCASCHDAHIALRYPDAAGDGLSGITTTCETCHPNHEISLNGSPKQISCESCHMAPASKSAVGMQVGNGWRGDVKTHIWDITTEAVTKDIGLFNSEGDAVLLDEDGLASVTLDFACLACHTENDVAWAASFAEGIHENGIVTTDVEENQELPSEFALYQNYPNPFNPSTTIKFDLPKASGVTLSVYSITGELVMNLVDNMMPAGRHSFELNASNLSSGIYIYTINANDYVSSMKMILLK